MDSSSSPAPPGQGAGAERDHDEDFEMTDAPAHTYTKSQFALPSSAATSPDPHRATEQAPRVLETTEKPAIPKKKGQAAIKKAPKRGKGGNNTNESKSAKRPVKKGPASDAGADSLGEEEVEGADSDEGEDMESDNGPYCICRGPDDHRFMIGCDVCEDWFHGQCVGIDKDVGEYLIERFVCPNCTNKDEGVLTVFKKTCGYPKCKKPARLYDGQPKKERSHFCSDEHKQLWWERCLATLPKKSNPGSQAHEGLTQSQFVAVLESGLPYLSNDNTNDEETSTSGLPTEDVIMSDSINDTRPKGQEEPQLPKHHEKPQPLKDQELDPINETRAQDEEEPQAAKDQKESQPPKGQELGPIDDKRAQGQEKPQPSENHDLDDFHMDEESLIWFNEVPYTPEQWQLLAKLEAERNVMGKEATLFMQMVFVVDWCMDRRKALVAAQMIDDAACGYDYRLDTMGAVEPFKNWYNGADGRALFEGIPFGKGYKALGPNVPLSADPKDICDKKRCKVHQGWFAIFKRDLDAHIKELFAVLTSHYDREVSIRQTAIRKNKRVKAAKAAKEKEAAKASRK